MVQGNRAFVHPLDCQYLIEARVHERPVPLDHATLPNQDIRVTQRFLRDNEPLAVFLARSLVAAALDTPGLVDGDIREALDALIRTYRTLESGLYYETRPNNPLAARMFAVRSEEHTSELQSR